MIDIQLQRLRNRQQFPIHYSVIIRAALRINKQNGEITCISIVSSIGLCGGAMLCHALGFGELLGHSGRGEECLSNRILANR